MQSKTTKVAIVGGVVLAAIVSILVPLTALLTLVYLIYAAATVPREQGFLWGGAVAILSAHALVLVLGITLVAGGVGAVLSDTQNRESNSASSVSAAGTSTRSLWSTPRKLWANGRLQSAAL